MKYILNGQEVTREEFVSRGPKNKGWLSEPINVPPDSCYTEHSPLVSDGLGCMKNQVPEMREELRKRNIRGVRVRDNGQLEFTSRQGRREVMRMRGLADNDGGYGDVT